ncbi:MAG: ATP-binding cassette domain-containing protein [Caldiserica bacterium]|nr:ATP-binding cassette domain-containing protein [Caldisericota bacterium]
MWWRSPGYQSGKRLGGRDVLREVSFSVHAGEVFGILGPNGAGKTTLIRIIINLLKPDSGTVRLFGTERLEDVLSRVGYLPEERGIYTKARVLDTLRYFARLRGMGRKQAEQSAMRWLERMGMAEHARRKAGELSKGMQQKVQIACALLHEPEVVVLDEPFSGLDPLNTLLVEELIQELRGEGRTVLLSTHMIERAEVLCDRVLVVSEGAPVLYGSPWDIRRRYSGRYVVVEVEGELPELRGVRVAERRGSSHVLVLEDAAEREVLEQLLESGVRIRRFDAAGLSLREVFVRVAGEGARGC